MGLYKLSNTEHDIEDGVARKIKPDSIDYEKYFESWLENTPSMLLDDDESTNTVLWIGRQVSASVGDSEKFPDMIGIDSSGDLVIVELKKGRTPRDIIAQILEYASWGALLSYDDLNDIARSYYSKDKNNSNKSLLEIYREVFNLQEDECDKLAFNMNQKLYIVAEQTSLSVRQVCEYLRNNFKMNINILEYQVLKSKDDEFLLSVNKKLGFDDGFDKEYSNNKISITRSKWNGDEKVRDIIYKGVLDFTKGDKNITFQPKDIINNLVKKYPNLNRSTVRCQLIQNCVNHKSRKHYSSGQEDYFYYDNKAYRLYDNEKDGCWDWEGNYISK